MSSALHPRTDMGFTGPTKFSRSNVMECVECALLNTARPKGIRPKCPTATVQGHPASRCAIARGRNNEEARLRLTRPDSVRRGRCLDYSPGRGRRLQRRRSPVLRERSIGRSRLDHRQTAWRAGSAVPADERSYPRRRIFSLRDSLGAQLILCKKARPTRSFQFDENTRAFWLIGCCPARSRPVIFKIDRDDVARF
jgi:hypothetical protein